MPITVANVLYQQPDYVPSPPGTEIVVVGHEPSGRAVDPEIARERSRRQLLDASSYLATLGQHVAEKPGKHLRRVVEVGARVLERGVAVAYDQTCLPPHQ